MGEPAFCLLAQRREISVWRPVAELVRVWLLAGQILTNSATSGKRKCPVLDSSVGKDKGRPADRIALVTKALFAKIQLLQQLVIFRQVVPLQIIEEFATAGGHLQEAAA
jgi:hypothetical protein